MPDRTLYATASAKSTSEAHYEFDPETAVTDTCGHAAASPRRPARTGTQDRWPRRQETCLSPGARPAATSARSSSWPTTPKTCKFARAGRRQPQIGLVARPASPAQQGGEPRALLRAESTTRAGRSLSSPDRCQSGDRLSDERRARAIAANMGRSADMSRACLHIPNRRPLGLLAWWAWTSLSPRRNLAQVRHVG